VAGQQLWSKQGLVLGPSAAPAWGRGGQILPTPIRMSDGAFRLYCGFRDDSGVGRIGYVAVDERDPQRVLRVSPRPVLGPGEPGSFDDNGVIPGELVWRGDELWLYYIGFQLGHRVRFLAFTGLAVSVDGGESFERVSNAPILDRTDRALFFRALHCVLLENGVTRAWVLQGNSWVQGPTKSEPSYAIDYLESADGISFPAVERPAIVLAAGEHRLARPRITKTDGDTYRMFYSRAKPGVPYRLGYAESNDALNWRRSDDVIGLEPEAEGWEQGGMSFPAVATTEFGTYLFYNGAGMGNTGFGYARLESW
jgi:hypothetical protein